MLVRVRLLNDCVIDLNVAVEDTVEHLKEKIVDRAKYKFYLIRLVYQRKQFADPRCLSYYGVQNDSLIYQVMPLGGFNRPPIEPDIQEEECAVCFEEDQLVFTKPCMHVLCKICLRKMNSCPVCRVKLVPDQEGARGKIVHNMYIGNPGK